MQSCGLRWYQVSVDTQNPNTGFGGLRKVGLVHPYNKDIKE